MSPDAAASMPAFSIVHPSTRTLLIISAIPARCPLPEWMKTGKFAGSLAAFRNGSMGAGSSVMGLIAKTRYFIPAASVAERSAPLSAPPARSITVLIPRFFKAGIAMSRDVIEPPVDTVLSTNQKLLMPGTVKRLLFCADDSAGKPASITRTPLQRSRFRFMSIIEVIIMRMSNKPGGSVAASLIADLAAASRILAAHGVVDGFGHVSMRHPEVPARYLMARSVAPALVTPDDIIEYDLDSNPANADGRASFLERFIHGEIYKARPDIQSIVHSHSPSVIPFGLVHVPLQAMFHNAAFIAAGVPVFDIREKFGATDMLVGNREKGVALASVLGSKDIVLMRAHGSVA